MHQFLDIFQMIWNNFGTCFFLKLIFIFGWSHRIMQILVSNNHFRTSWKKKLINFVYFLHLEEKIPLEIKIALIEKYIIMIMINMQLWFTFLKSHLFQFHPLNDYKSYAWNLKADTVIKYQSPNIISFQTNAQSVTRKIKFDYLIIH